MLMIQFRVIMDDIVRPKSRKPLSVTDKPAGTVEGSDVMSDSEEGIKPAAKTAKIKNEPKFVPPEEVESDIDIMAAAQVEEDEEPATQESEIDKTLLLEAKNNRIKNHRIDLHMPRSK